MDEVAGFDSVLNTFDKNTILLEDSEEYTTSNLWGLKMPNIFVATFEIKGTGSSFNFRNTSNGDATVGYTLTFSGTGLTLKYGNGDLTTAIIPNLKSTYGKVYLTYEKQYFTVTVDGTRVLAYKDDVTRTPPDGEYIKFFAGTETPGFQKLKVVAGHLISDGTSNVSLYGGLAVTSNLEVGSSNLFVDTVNSRVGMGTTTPEATLHVSGNAYVSSNLEVGSSNLFVDTVNSRVGMGTTTPEATLHVSGNAYVSSNLEVGTANLFVDTLNTRVGVGTTEPKEALDIVGNMHLTRVSNVSQIKVDSNVVTEYTGPHDRPLRKYPEVAMTSASQGGYVVTPSTENATNVAYHMFDGDRSTRWRAKTTDSYDASSPYLYNGTNSSSISDTSGTPHDGAFLKLELPKAIKLDYTVIRENADPAARTPGKITFLASTNGTDWTFLKEFSGMSNTALDETYTINDTNYYNHFAFVVKNLSDEDGGLDLGEWELYGHEEGSGSLDTTLKSVYNVPATTGTQLEVYYDAKDLTTMPGTVTDLSPNSNDGSPTSVSVSDGAFVFNGTSSLLEKTSLSIPGGDNPLTFSFWVKNDDFDNIQYILRLGDNQTTYQTIALYKNSSNQIIFATWTLDFPINYTFTTNRWNHISLVYPGGGWKQSNLIAYVDGKPYTFGGNVSYGGIGGTVMSLATSLTLRLGGFSSGNTIFDGSIANFRLYSKALNADQVKELYDYQKDYFLGSKSQVTLYKGHLGVGVTEPSGQLELAGDERIQEYPPGPLSNYDTYIPGHGVFCAYASSGYTNGSTQNRLAYNAFDKASGSGGLNDMWQSVDSLYNGGSGTNQSYTGSVRLAENLPKGHYLGLKMPYPVKITSFIMGAYFNSGYRAVGDGLIVGRNTNNPTWEVVHTLTNSFMAGVNGFNIAANAPAILITTPSIPIDNTKYYDEYALVVTGTLGSSLVTVSEWRLFGTPGPTTLDKGSLTLGRSLDVPRISRYDVDTETPRPEKLVMDFDTTVNSSPTDISGKGNHGAFYNGASYYPVDKAFNFDGTNDSIRGIISNPSGDWVHSISFWFKLGIDQSAITGGRMDPFTIVRQGSGGVNRTTDLAEDDKVGHYSSCDIAPTTIDWYFYGNDARFNISGLKAGEWHHLTFAYEGGGAVASRHAYFDGVEYPNVGTSTTPLAMFQNSVLALGMDFGRVSSSPSYFNGQISNFKVYDTVLEASEVKKLYNLGRTGRSMVISDTAVGIGKVPEAQLDVRGTARFDTISDFLKIDHPGNQLSLSRSDTDANEFRWYTWGNGCNWFTPYTGMSIYIGRDGQTIDEFDFYSVTTVKQGGTTLHSSDDRLKRDETFITNATNSILKLKPQTYIKKHRLPENENDTDIPEQFEAGLIAQDVWYDAPELRFLVHPSKDANPSETKPISPDPNDPTQDPDYSSWGTRQAYVNYEGFLPYLIKSNQEIYTELQAEKAKNEALETQVSDLLVRVTALENA